MARWTFAVGPCGVNLGCRVSRSLGCLADGCNKITRQLWYEQHVSPIACYHKKCSKNASINVQQASADNTDKETQMKTPQ
jgi:hypothetical protein